MLYSDNMMIPKTSDRQDLAHGLDQLVLRSGALGADRGRARPTSRRSRAPATELAKIAPELASSPLVNPPDELRARLHVFRALTDAEDTEFNRVFQDAIGA